MTLFHMIMYVRNIQTDEVFKAYQWSGSDRPPFKPGSVAKRKTFYVSVWMVRISSDYWKPFYPLDWILEDKQGNKYIEEQLKLKNEYEEENSVENC